MQPGEAMKILYIVPFVPWAVKVRSFNLIPRLARRHEIISGVRLGVPVPVKSRRSGSLSIARKVVHVRHSVEGNGTERGGATDTDTIADRLL